jgi:hypothetical protein
LSLRSVFRMGSNITLLQFVQIGSSMSLRSANRLGSAFKIEKMFRAGHGVSVLGWMHVGSSVSLRQFS